MFVVELKSAKNILVRLYIESKFYSPYYVWTYLQIVKEKFQWYYFFMKETEKAAFRNCLFVLGQKLYV